MVFSERFRNHHVCVSEIEGCTRSPIINVRSASWVQGLAITFYVERVQIIFSEEKWNWVVNWIYTCV